YLSQRSAVGVVGLGHLPAPDPTAAAGPASWFVATPPPPGAPLAALERACAAAALDRARPRPYPPLFLPRGDSFDFCPRYLERTTTAGPLVVRPLDDPVPAGDPDDDDFLEAVDRRALHDRRVDLLLVVPRGVTR